LISSEVFNSDLSLSSYLPQVLATVGLSSTPGKTSLAISLTLFSVNFFSFGFLSFSASILPINSVFLASISVFLVSFLISSSQVGPKTVAMSLLLMVPVSVLSLDLDFQWALMASIALVFSASISSTGF